MFICPLKRDQLLLNGQADDQFSPDKIVHCHIFSRMKKKTDQVNTYSRIHMNW